MVSCRGGGMYSGGGGGGMYSGGGAVSPSHGHSYAQQVIIICSSLKNQLGIYFTFVDKVIQVVYNRIILF